MADRVQVPESDKPLDEQVRELREELASLKQGVGQYSLSQLKTRLSTDLQPDGDTFLGPKTVGTSSLEDDSVTSVQLADNSVGSDQIAADAVTASEIAAGAVGTSELADGIVVELAATANVKVNMGFVTGAPWGGGTLLQPVIAHGLGAVPTGAVASMVNGGSIYYSTHYIGINGWNSAVLIPEWASEVGGLGGVSNVCWMAWVVS